MAGSFLTPKDEVLRRVGRNVVNLQRLEAALKALVLAAKIEGPLVGLGSVQALHSRSLRAESLGTITNLVNRDVFEPRKEAVPPDDIGEGWVSISSRIEIDPQSLKKKRGELRAVGRERNQLIHHRLLEVDLESAESCSVCLTWLDEQNERICAQLNDFGRAVTTRIATVAKLAAFMQSEQYEEVLKRTHDDA